jgi:hypothetical protein
MLMMMITTTSTIIIIIIIIQYDAIIKYFYVPYKLTHEITST